MRRLPALLALGSTALTLSAAPSLQYNHGDPSDDEQYSLELINRARMNPTAEGIFLAGINDSRLNFSYTFFNVDRNQVKIDFAALTPRPPLAFNSRLMSVARFQSQDQAANNYQGHSSATGGTQLTRLTNFGYANFTVVGENVFAKIADAFVGHVGLNVDFGLPTLEHRKAIMDVLELTHPSIYREIGIGIVPATGSNVKPFVLTQEFGTELPTANTAFLTGVAYRDGNHDSLYSLGEGMAGIRVMPDNGDYFALTSKSGGYTIPLQNLPAGTTSVQLTFSGGGLMSPVTKTVALNGTNNVKADLVPTVDLVNISTRLRVSTGDNVAIAGFVVNGSANKRVIIRALGPSLARAGVADTLSDPSLQIVANGAQIATNDNWKTSQQTEIQNSGFAPTNDNESAVIRTLAPGVYTAIVSGVGGTSGIASVEVYDLDIPANSHPINLSTRGQVQTGDGVMIAGFVISGPVAKRVIVRAIGPDLANRGVTGFLQDPTLSLISNGVTIASNNNWKDTDKVAIQATGLAPNDDRESAIVATLNPGVYTAIVSGVSNSTGVALVEVYDLD